jgi:hypothetical protein
LDKKVHPVFFKPSLKPGTLFTKIKKFGLPFFANYGKKRTGQMNYPVGPGNNRIGLKIT